MNGNYNKGDRMKRLIVFVMGLLLYAQTAYGGCFNSISDLVKWEPASGLIGFYIDTDGDKIADIIYYMNVEKSYPIKCDDCKNGKEDLQEFAEYFLFRTAVVPYEGDDGNREIIVAEKVGNDLVITTKKISDDLPDPIVYKISKQCIIVHKISKKEQEREARAIELLKRK